MVKSSLGVEGSAAARAELLEHLFVPGVPTLWCPSLTHYTSDGAIDGHRIAAHLRRLAPDVKGFLIPGSTSDGWELSEQEFWTLLEVALQQARSLKLHLLIGVLKAGAREALTLAEKVVEHIKQKSHQSDLVTAFMESRVCGIAICAPRGKEVSQEDMERGLTAVLETGVPVALYQLPQVTQNEIGSQLAATLAERFPNFVLFKDSSGADRVVLSGKNLGGVFTMRGAEGNYVQWLRGAGGAYDGFLLSTANCFADKLSQMIAHADADEMSEARLLSDKVTGIINEVFQLVQPVREGNVFTNANKAIDHFLAYGPRATELPGPRLHAGIRLPDAIIRQTGTVLEKYGLKPGEGYLGDERPR
jgi:dihydrodipicolinate synthase/N-acetylneuraminate lyase